MDSVTVSIIICTRDRAMELQGLLASVRHLALPETLKTELIIIDNGSTDGTSEIIRSCRISGLTIRYISEPQRGKSNAYNAGLAAARGEILLFTDDDVRLPENWVIGMSTPILSGETDAVAGGVKIAPHLERGWMEKPHRLWLASTDAQDPQDFSLVGANMAFSRRVLERVPQFDPELGPGGLGFSEDSLFSMQLREADCRIVPRYDVTVEHHFDSARLLHRSFADRVEKEGICTAYVLHHWFHEASVVDRFALRRNMCRLIYLCARGRQGSSAEGISTQEMQLRRKIAEAKHRLLLAGRPRNYQKKGLVKLHASL